MLLSAHHNSIRVSGVLQSNKMHLLNLKYISVDVTANAMFLLVHTHHIYLLTVIYLLIFNLL